MTAEFIAETGRLDAVVAATLAVPRADVQRAIAAETGSRCAEHDRRATRRRV